MLELHVWIYSACLVGACTYAILRGDWPERWAAWVNVTASVASFLVALLLPHRRWSAAMGITWSIDALACLAFMILMIRSRRLWLIPCFGFSVAATTAHMARMLQVSLPPIVYYVSEARWAYLNLILLAIGAWRHPRRREAEPSPAS
jgi:hypothetical protein